MNKKDSYNKLFSLIMQAKYPIAFTGAGISTLAGIKDFRGKNGLYKQPNSEQMFDINIFYKNPALFYGMAKDFIYGLDEKNPAIVHSVLSFLEQKGILKAIITQNIDLLHQKAGSSNIFEIHGSPSIHHCINCAYSTSFEKIAKIVKKGKVPICPECGSTIKPDITFFGEALPYHTLMAAEAECLKTDLMLILGTSLVVYPAAALPAYTLHAGGKIVIVNDQRTQFDNYAELLFDDLEETFKNLEEKCKSL